MSCVFCRFLDKIRRRCRSIFHLGISSFVTGWLYRGLLIPEVFVTEPVSQSIANVTEYVEDSRARLDDCLLDKGNHRVYGVCSISTAQMTHLGEGTN
jgi:hypothetical protein